MTPTPWASRAGVPVVAVAVVFYLAFSIGAIAGAEAAVNDSYDYQEQYENVSTISEKTKSDVRNNTSGYRQKIVMASLGPTVEGAETSTLWGMEFGYAHPTAGEVNGHIAPYASIAAIALALIQNLRRLRGDVL